MKFLIVLCAAVACAVAKPQFLAPWAIPQGYAYSAAPWASPLGHPLGHPLGRPLAYSAPHWSAAPALAYSGYSAYSAPIAAAPVAVAAPVAHATKSQYHAQDELGQASYGHTEPSQTHHAVQDAFGNKVGSFSYTAPDGRILRTDYVADALGYRVTSNNLPVAEAGLPQPVHDTPEVAIAKAQHLAAHGIHHGLHRIAKRSVTLLQTPASTAPLAYAAAPVVAHHAVAAPLAYAAAPAIHHAVGVPVAYAAAPAITHHAVAYAAAPAIHHAVAAPVAYAAAPAIAHHTVSTAPVLREAIHTTVVNNPGHAVSYRVD